MNLDIIIGKPLTEAKQILSMSEHTYRISNLDGVTRMLTENVVPNRVNLTVQGNIVTSYSIG